MSDRRFDLSERDIPRQWYNIVPDLPVKPPPPLHPGTGQPIGPDALTPIFPMELILQEVSTDRWISIPEEVLDIYRLWRPTPLFRADRLEKALGTPAKIYYKYEGVSPAGSHKPNTAVPQAYYNMKEGVKRIATETGAGQWGTALAFATYQFGIECKVYMVRVSHDAKPYRRSMMQTWGASVVASPSNDTASGRKFLEQDPEQPRQPRHRYQRGGRGRRHPGGYEVRARERAQPCSPAPDGDRPRGEEGVREDGGLPGRRRRLRRRREQLRGDFVSLPCGQVRGTQDPDRGRRAGFLPDPDPRGVPLRLRRHGPADAAPADVHTRPYLHAPHDPRRAACATTEWRPS